MTKPKHTNIRINDGSHDHQFQLVFFEDGPGIRKSYPHRHGYQGITSFDVGHRHRLGGVTAPAPDVPDHVHEYRGTTTFDDGHVHHFSGVTGPPIPLPDGGHYHIIEGETTVNGEIPHTHSYTGEAR
jgi:YmaF family